MNTTRYAQLRQERDSDSVSIARPGDASVVSEKGGKKEVVRITRPETSHRNKNTGAPKNLSFGQTSSQILNQQSQWLNNDAVPLLILPLIEPSTMVLVASEPGQMKLLLKNAKNYHLLPPLLSLDCAIQDMNYDTCITAQKRCIAHLSKLRTSLVTLSHEAVEQRLDQPWNLPVSSSVSALQICSAKIIKVSS